VEGSCEHCNEPLGFIKCWGNYSVAERLSAFQEGFSTIEL
jgi:hypothetical protein